MVLLLRSGDPAAQTFRSCTVEPLWANPIGDEKKTRGLRVRVRAQGGGASAFPLCPGREREREREREGGREGEGEGERERERGEHAGLLMVGGLASLGFS